MPLLQPNEYNASYFDGISQDTRHNAGYSKYERWYRNDGENSLGEYWKDKAARWINYLTLSGKKVLEIGSAKGFFVEDLREAGVDAYGLDVSQYAYDQAATAVQPYLTVANATDLGTLGYTRNEFDVLITSRFLECLSDAEIAQFITDASFISKKQVHLITPPERLNQTYYNAKTVQEWLALDWPKGTVIAPYNNEADFVTK